MTWTIRYKTSSGQEFASPPHEFMDEEAAIASARELQLYPHCFTIIEISNTAGRKIIAKELETLLTKVRPK